MTTGRWRRCHLRLPCLAEEGRWGGCLHTIATHVDRNNIALPRWRSVETGTIRRSPNAGAGEIIRRQRNQDLPRAMGHDVPIDETAFDRSEEHTSELQSLMRSTYAVFCLTKKINYTTILIISNNNQY